MAILPVAPTGRVKGKRRLKVAALRREWHTRVRFHLKFAMLHAETADGELQNCRHGVAVPASDFRLRQVAAAARIYDEGDPRRFHVKRAYVDIALHQRDDFQPHGDGGGAKQRRLAGGLGAVQNKRIGLDPHGRPVESKRAYLGASAGGSFNRAHQPGARLAAKPLAAQHQHAGHRCQQRRRGHRSGNPQEAAFHWSASS
jgi:hypothetical protein